MRLAIKPRGSKYLVVKDQSLHNSIAKAEAHLSSISGNTSITLPKELAKEVNELKQTLKMSANYKVIALLIKSYKSTLRAKEALSLN